MCVPGYCNGSCWGNGGGGYYYAQNPFGNQGFSFNNNQQNPFANAGFSFARRGRDPSQQQANPNEDDIVTYTYEDEEPDEIQHEPKEWNDWTTSSTLGQMQRHFQRKGMNREGAKRAADGTFESMAPKRHANFRAAGSQPRTRPQPSYDPPPRERTAGPMFSDPLWEHAYQNLLNRGIPQDTAEEVIREQIERESGQG